MSDVDDELVECFSAVFPELTRSQILQASRDTVEEWDSLASVTLMAVLEEVFALQIPPADLPALGSFAAVTGYVQGSRDNRGSG